MSAVCHAKYATDRYNQTYGIWSIYNSDLAASGCPDSRGILINIAENTWSETNSIMYQIFISYSKDVYTATWINGVSFGEWKKISQL